MTARRRLSAAALALCGLGFVAGSTAGAQAPSGEAVATFRTSDATFPNPERGFYRPLSTELSALDGQEAQAAFDAGYRLLYTRIDLSPYREAPLPPAFLAQLDRAFAAARAAGVKLIVRATYNYPRGETGYQDALDAPLPRVLEHIEQLGSVWRRNVDVIAFVQAGFIGAWGEWHASSNELTSPDARTRIKDALLAAVPAERFVQFRYPPYIEEWAPNLPTLDTAVANRFRVAFHNDCFLASQTDVGTFSEDEQERDRQRAYIAQLGELSPIGGETCNPADDPGARPRTGCDDILGEGRRFNLSYLNTSYYRRLFHERWIAGGCMPEVERSLGYRVALLRASHPERVTAGSTLVVQLRLRNSGWARIYNPRPVTILLRGEGAGQVLRLVASGVDARRWLPGAEAEAHLRLTLPGDLPSGRYAVSFALPDANARLAGDPRYAIRPANGDDEGHGQVWNPTTGAFDLGTTITVD